MKELYTSKRTPPRVLPDYNNFQYYNSHDLSDGVGDLNYLQKLYKTTNMLVWNQRQQQNIQIFHSYPSGFQTVANLFLRTRGKKIAYSSSTHICCWIHVLYKLLLDTGFVLITVLHPSVFQTITNLFLRTGGKNKLFKFYPYLLLDTFFCVLIEIFYWNFSHSELCPLAAEQHSGSNVFYNFDVLNPSRR